MTVIIFPGMHIQNKQEIFYTKKEKDINAMIKYLNAGGRGDKKLTNLYHGVEIYEKAAFLLGRPAEMECTAILQANS